MRLSPSLWWTQENKTKTRDWQLFEEHASDLCNAARTASQKHWMEHCESLDPAENPSKVSQTVNSLNGNWQSDRSETVVQHPMTSKPCVSDSSKAKAFKIQHATVCEKPRHESRSDRHQHQSKKQKARKHVAKADTSADPDAKKHMHDMNSDKLFMTSRTSALLALMTFATESSSIPPTSCEKNTCAC